MRLGQLARKLALRPSEIVEFLATKHIQIDDGSNTRLLDDHVLLVMHHFAPGDTQEVVVELAKEKEAVETPVVEEVKPLFVTEVNIESESEAENKIELIKAPKVELTGLKVLGKIELPEPKKKEPTTEIEVETSSGEPDKKPTREIRKATYSNQKRERPNQRREKNPISAQRDQEAQERERKREAKAQKDKEQRTKNYLKRVTSAPTKRVKMVEEPVMEMSDAELATPPKSLLGKFFRWLKS